MVDDGRGHVVLGHGGGEDADGVAEAVGLAERVALAVGEAGALRAWAAWSAKPRYCCSMVGACSWPSWKWSRTAPMVSSPATNGTAATAATSGSPRRSVPQGVALGEGGAVHHEHEGLVADRLGGRAESREPPRAVALGEVGAESDLAEHVEGVLTRVEPDDRRARGVEVPGREFRDHLRGMLRGHCGR